MSEAESLKRIKVGVIGCGNMGASLVKGLVESGFFPQNVSIFDPDTKKMNALKKEMNIRIAKGNRPLASLVDVLILAVKPNLIDPVLEEIKTCTPATTLIISIAAGVPINRIQKFFADKPPVVRAMPNMPATIRHGMTAYALGSMCYPKHRKLAEKILQSLGETIEVKEKMLDLVTAVSGSGPAYFFLLTEKIIEAATHLGMKADMAKKLVYQTAIGSANLLTKSTEDPDVLIGRVASKGGTTEAALKVFAQKGFGKIVVDAVKAAETRAHELSQ